MGPRAVALSILSSLGLIFVLIASAPVVAQEAEPLELTGCVSPDESGESYVLTDESAGEEIRLEGAMVSAEHSDQLVTVAGEWAEDDDGQEVFRVTEIERLGACA